MSIRPLPTRQEIQRKWGDFCVGPTGDPGYMDRRDFAFGPATSSPADGYQAGAQTSL